MKTVKLVNTMKLKSAPLLALILTIIFSTASFAASIGPMSSKQKDAYDKASIEIAKTLTAAAIQNIPTGKCYVSKDKSAGYIKVNQAGQDYLRFMKAIKRRLDGSVYIYRMDKNYFMCNRYSKSYLAYTAFIQLPFSSEFFTCPPFYDQTLIEAGLTVAHEIGHMVGLLGQRHVVVEPIERLIRLCSLVEQERITNKSAVVPAADLKYVHKN